MQDGAVTIRRARLRDVRGIRAILNDNIAHKTNTMDAAPWSMLQTLAWFLRHNERYPILVAEYAGGVAGYGALSAFREGDAFAPCMENSVYVRADVQRRGIGTRLLEALKRVARAQGARVLVATVTADNQASLGLHAACGFVRMGVLRGACAYRGRSVDIALMQCSLQGDPPGAEGV
nr:GNAT family N-acetyltransferase [Maliibacterium massiliense]